jgi:sulfonate transport system permease protein
MFPAPISYSLEDPLAAAKASLGSPRIDRVRGLLARASLAWVLPALVLGAWYTAARLQLIAPQILPPPRLVKDTLFDLIKSGDLLSNGAISFGRLLAGFALGSGLGLALGIAMGLSRRVQEYVSPLFTAVAQVPVLGWIPLLMMLVGIGEALKVVVILTATLVPVAVNTASGIRSVPAAYLEVARVMRFSRARLLRRVILPGSAPAMFSGLRHGLMQGWLALVTVELLASSEGLGFMIVWGRQLFQLDLVLVAIAIVGVVGLLLDRALAFTETRLLPWRREAFR